MGRHPLCCTSARFSMGWTELLKKACNSANGDTPPPLGRRVCETTIRHIIIAHFVCLKHYFPIKERTITHTLHPHDSQIFFRYYFPLRVLAFSLRKLDLRITHFGVAHPNFVGELISGRITHNNPNNYTKIFWGI